MRRPVTVGELVGLAWAGARVLAGGPLLVAGRALVRLGRWMQPDSYMERRRNDV